MAKRKIIKKHRAVHKNKKHKKIYHGRKPSNKNKASKVKKLIKLSKHGKKHKKK